MKHHDGKRNVDKSCFFALVSCGLNVCCFQITVPRQLSINYSSHSVINLSLTILFGTHPSTSLFIYVCFKRCKSTRPSLFSYLAGFCFVVHCICIPHDSFISLCKKELGTGETAQQFRALPLLQKNPDSALSGSRGPSAPLWPLRVWDRDGSHVHMLTKKLMHVKKY